MLVDGVDVREMTQDDLRARIGFVPQKAVLFTGTIAANIRYGREDATDDEMRHAATVAQAIEFIDAMPGRSTRRSRKAGPISRADRSSGSPIARAIVRRPDVYVFDDSFSALDFATDARLRAALQARNRERHRFCRRAAGQHGHRRRPHRRARQRPRRRHRHA